MRAFTIKFDSVGRAEVFGKKAAYTGKMVFIQVKLVPDNWHLQLIMLKENF